MSTAKPWRQSMVGSSDQDSQSVDGFGSNRSFRFRAPAPETPVEKLIDVTSKIATNLPRMGASHVLEQMLEKSETGTCDSA